MVTGIDAMLVMSSAGESPNSGRVPDISGPWDRDRLIAFAILTLVGLVLIGLANLLMLVWRTRGPDYSDFYGNYLDRYLGEMRLDRYDELSPERIDKATLASMRAMAYSHEAWDKRQKERRARLDTFCARPDAWLPQRLVSLIRRGLAWWFRL